MFSPLEFQQLIARFPACRIGLVGDLFLDRYLELEPDVRELSIETGLEAYQIERVRNHAGALGTILNNLAALGATQLLPLSVVGDDGHGHDLMKALQELPVDDSWIIRDDTRLTPTYIKPLRPTETGWQELNRLDVRTRAGLSATTSREVCQRLRSLYGECDGLIVLDQISEPDCGVVNQSVRQVVADLAARKDKPVYIDSRNQLGEFSTGILKGNATEIAKLTTVEGNTEQRLASLAAITGQPVICTLGESGAMIGYSDGMIDRVPTFPVSGPIDIVGAGDAATSGIILSLTSGATLRQAVLVGNLVASITVQQLGTTGTASPHELLARFEQFRECQA